MKWLNQIHYSKRPCYCSGIKVVSELYSFGTLFRKYQDTTRTLTIGSIPLAISSFIRLL